MKFGLSDTDLDYIVDVIKNFKEIDKAIIFGSRAKGNYKTGSDIDIAIIGSDVTFDTVANVHYMLEEESPMPYLFDIIDYNNLDHVELKAHIDRVGIALYQKDN